MRFFARFQNCLEMTGPSVTPDRGIAIYHNDPTQGPKCALACPAATVYRNYFVGGRGQGGGAEQIDCLSSVGEVLENGNGETKRWWGMKNGYALPVNSKSMSGLKELLETNSELAKRAGAELMVGVHWSTSVKPPHTHRVGQSTIPLPLVPRPPEPALKNRVAYCFCLYVFCCAALVAKLTYGALILW